jgi:two-component system, cell cycle response regulator
MPILSKLEDTTGVTAIYDSSQGRSFARDRPCLIVLSGLHIGQMFPLEAGRQVVGRSRSAQIRLVDEGVSRQHIAIGEDAEGTLWLEDLDSRNGTFCNGEPIVRHVLHDGDKIQLGRSTMLRFTYLDEHDESFQRRMFDSALRDGLTRVYNKRYFTERLRAEFHFAVRHEVPLSLLLLDLDHFKLVNDRHGHVAGDFVLTEFADSAQQSVRSEDVFARFGGEEFAVISRATAVEEAAHIAERLRVLVASLDIRYENRSIPLTVSVGVAGLPGVSATNPVELVMAADRALYRAKVLGRNRVAIYDPQKDDDTEPGQRHGEIEDTQPLG